MMAGWLSRTWGRMFAGTPPPTDDFWYQNACGSLTAAGIPITPEAAMKVSAFYRGVDLLSTSLAMLPLNMYKRLPDEKGAEVARDHPLQDVLHRKPNGYQDSFRWRRQLARRLIMRGNGYCFNQPGLRGPFDQLPPITTPVKPKLKDGRITYTVHNNNGTSSVYTQDEIFHLCGPSDDGVEGVGVVQWAKDSLGLALSTESYAQRLFSQGALYGTTLKFPTKPSDEQKAAYRESFQQATSGLANAHGVFITYGGAELKREGLTGEETQFIASRKFSIDDIARWLGVPPHMIGSLERSTNNNIEQQSLEFVTYSLGPWLTLWEMAINDQLVIDYETYYAEFVRDALVRGDIAARWKAYQIAVSTGTVTRNEVRRKENMKALPGLDTPIEPAYLSGSPGQPPKANTPPAADTEADPEDAAARDARDIRAAKIAQASAARLLRKEIAAVQAAAVRNAGDADAFAVAVTDFYAKHVGLVSETLDLTKAEAERYCAGQANQIIDGDWLAALALWQTDAYAAGLGAIALEEQAA